MGLEIVKLLNYTRQSAIPSQTTSHLPRLVAEAEEVVVAEAEEVVAAEAEAEEVVEVVVAMSCNIHQCRGHPILILC